jgi:hypothetical protein
MTLPEKQKIFIVEMLWDLEQQINDGEYYSYDRDEFNEHVETAKKLYGIDYYLEKAKL